jgi:CubicO group peptidase (beta-lactamase class C family)
MNRSARLFVACVSLFALGSSATAQSVASRVRQRQRKPANPRRGQSGQGSGVSVAIMQRGRLVYSEGIGVVDRARNRPVDPHTRFNVGSVAKMFAAASILLLVEEGKVDLDAPVASYISEFTMADPRYRAITVSMLLNHSAGLPAVTGFVGFGLDTTTHAVLLEVLARSTLQHDPGAMSRYSNDGFTLAEIVVERASGRKYMDFLAKRIFVPLGMRHTGPNLGELGRRGVAVAEFYDAKHGKKYPREIVPVYAAGGISSTAEDLCRFGDALMPGGTPLLSPASLAELLRPQPTSLGSTLRHTAEFSQFGWDYSLRVGPTDNLLVFAKGGNTPFYTSDLQILPEQGIVIAFIISGRSSGDKLTQPILAGLLEDLDFAVASGAARPPQGQPIPPNLDRYVGSYAMETGAVSLSIDASRRKLLLTVLPGQGPPGELIYEGGYFYGPGSDTRFYFLTYEGKDLLVASTITLALGDTGHVPEARACSAAAGGRGADERRDLAHSQRAAVDGNVRKREADGDIPHLRGTPRLREPRGRAQGRALRFRRHRRDCVARPERPGAFFRRRQGMDANRERPSLACPRRRATRPRHYHRDDRPRRLQRMARRRAGCGASFSHTRSRPCRHHGGRHRASRQPRRR